jgi:hypothetical protein
MGKGAYLLVYSPHVELDWVNGVLGISEEPHDAGEVEFARGRRVVGAHKTG